jgi:hypothetical protein
MLIEKPVKPKGERPIQQMSRGDKKRPRASYDHSMEWTRSTAVELFMSRPRSPGVAVLLMVTAAFVACNHDSRPPKAGAPHRKAKVRATSPGKAVAAPRRRRPDEVVVTGSLTAYDPAFRWHQDSAAGHDDGIAPLATFQLQHPKMFRGRQVRLLFKYKQATASLITTKTPLKTTFTFSLPRGYFDRSKPVPLIDNSLVKELAHSAP